MLKITKFVLIFIVPILIGIIQVKSNESQLLVGIEWRFKIHSNMPIRNSSLLKSSDSHLFLDANEIATIILSETKNQVSFSEAVSTWSRGFFDEAECFIPLCRTTTEEFIWEEASEESFKPSGEAEFEACCAVADTRLPEEEDEVEKCIVNPLQSCRVQEYNAPCGDITDASTPSFENDEVICTTTAKMEVDVRFFDLENNEVCCLQCGCFGDPRCVSFDGTSDIWVLCDGRGPKIPNDLDSRCQIQEEICIEQFDHEDRSCQWIDLTPEEEETWTILTNGSQCVPNDLSADSWIVMYEFDEFGLEVRQINRGVIDAVEIRLDDELFFLEAGACDQGGKNTSWQLEGEYVMPPDSFAQIIQELGDDHIEIVWAISQTSTAMHVRLRCLRQRDANGNKSQPRIHVEALVEPEADLQGRLNTNGFCVNNEFDQRGSTENTEIIENGEGCTPADISKAEQVDIARALCGDSILFGTIPSCLVSFCEENFFPSFLDEMDCLVSFGDGIDGFQFRDTFCKAMTFTETDSDECKGVWDSLGPLNTINIFYLNANPPQLEQNCAEGVDDLPKELGDCEAGVSLQYLNEELEWITFISIPERRPPCGILDFNIVNHAPIFLNPIRWTQCTIPSGCITATNTLCRTQTRFSADIELIPVSSLGVALPTRSPTTQPTEFPTIITPAPTVALTNFPSRAPTEKPTQAPTEFPSRTPSETPTQEPTSFPIKEPTESPTTSPTAFPTALKPEITSSPTAFPTNFPTETGTTAFPTTAPTDEPTAEFPLCPHCQLDKPTASPTESPTNNPSTSPTQFPTKLPTNSPTKFPTTFPTVIPTSFPTGFPTLNPTTKIPTESPTESPTKNPTIGPSVSPTRNPTTSPTTNPTVSPTSFPTANPTESPTTNPTTSPTDFPTVSPTEFPTMSPTGNPTESPSKNPTTSPTNNPSESPTRNPTESPTTLPTNEPTADPTTFPSESPTESPTTFPTENPTCNPTSFPSVSPTANPTKIPTPFPTELPTTNPSLNPTETPTESPTFNPTESPSINPTLSPTAKPTIRVFSEDDCNCGNFGGDQLRTTKTSEKYVVSSLSLTSRKRLELKEAGELVVYAMYDTTTEAEKELLVNDAQVTLNKVNTALSSLGMEITAVHCEISLLVSEVNVSSSTNDNIISQKDESWQFFGFNNKVAPLLIFMGLLLLAATVGIGVWKYSTKLRAAKLKRSASANFPPIYDI